MPINFARMQELVLGVAGLAIAAGGLMLAFRGMTRHFSEAITGLVGFVIGLVIIGVGLFSHDSLKSLATSLAALVFKEK